MTSYEIKQDDAAETTLFKLMTSIREETGCASCVFGELRPEAGGIVCHIREDGYTGELPRKIDYDYSVNIYSCERWATTPKQLENYEHIVQGKRQKITIILS